MLRDRASRAWEWMSEVSNVINVIAPEPPGWKELDEAMQDRLPLLALAAHGAICHEEEELARVGPLSASVVCEVEAQHIAEALLEWADAHGEARSDGPDTT